MSRRNHVQGLERCQTMLPVPNTSVSKYFKEIGHNGNVGNVELRTIQTSEAILKS